MPGIFIWHVLAIFIVAKVEGKYFRTIIVVVLIREIHVVVVIVCTPIVEAIEYIDERYLGLHIEKIIEAKCVIEIGDKVTK